MKSDFLKTRGDFISVLLFAFAAVLAVCVFVGLVDFFVTSARAEQLVKEAVGRGNLEPNEIDEFLASSKELADELKKKNLFVPALQEKGHPVKDVMGIMGKEVLISGKWYKVGDKIGEAEIVSIEPTQIKVKWNGSVKSFAPIAAVDSSKLKAAVQKKPEKVVSKEKMAKKAIATAVKTEDEIEQSFQEEEDPLAWMGLELTDSQREKLELIFSKMPDEFKEQMKQQWNNMTDEQKQEGLEEIDRMSMGDLEREMDEMDEQLSGR